MSNYVIPTNNYIKELLDPLFGSEVTVSEGALVEPADAYLANYIDDEDKPVAVCAADISMVAFSGSVMMLIPVGGAEDAIQSKELTEVMQECYYEVVNILSRALMDANSAHLRLEKVYPPGTNTGLLDAVGGEVEVVSYKIAIPGYGDGNVTFTLQ